MDGTILLFGFLLGLFVCVIIFYLCDEQKAKEPESVMDSEIWPYVKEMNRINTERKDENTELQSKVRILEKEWFESHPCVYRKPKSICTGTHGYSFVYENVLTCHYPSPEGGTKWEKDMLSYCSKCKVRKEPDKVD